MAELIHNERLKLQANALDRASTASFSIGVLGPTAGTGGAASIAGPLAWLAGVFILHVSGYLLLGRLRP